MNWVFKFVEIRRKSQNEYENICIFYNINYLKLLSNCKGKKSNETEYYLCYSNDAGLPGGK